MQASSHTCSNVASIRRRGDHLAHHNLSRIILMSADTNRVGALRSLDGESGDETVDGRARFPRLARGLFGGDLKCLEVALLRAELFEVALVERAVAVDAGNIVANAG